MTGLDAKVAIVTGAARGIGAAIARALDARGATVVVADVSGDENALAAELTNGLGMHCDVAIEEDVEAMIAQTVERFGRLDVLCNNAGIDGELGPLSETSTANFDRVVDVNMRGVFFGMRQAIPAMITGGGGSIVNIASIAAVVAFAGTSAYAASKAGVIGLTRVAALEYGAAGVRVNAILPGVIATQMLVDLRHTDPATYQIIVDDGESMAAQKRLGRPEEIGSVAAFLASDEASFVTGAAIPVDGGYTVC